MVQRQLVEGDIDQGSVEQVPYGDDTAALGTPSFSSVVVIDLSSNSDVTSTVMPSGSNSVSGTVITLKPLQLLTAGHRYRIAIRFTVGGGLYEDFFFVRCSF